MSFLVLVNCKWSSWSSYSTCSKSCGSGGTQSRTRSKTQVEKYGGHCSGSTSDSKSCYVKACPGRHSFFLNCIYWKAKIHLFAQRSFDQNKVLSRNILQQTVAEVPCFAQMKIVHNTVLKMNGLCHLILQQKYVN